jgi:hypothetical protein
VLKIILDTEDEWSTFIYNESTLFIKSSYGGIDGYELCKNLSTSSQDKIWHEFEARFFRSSKLLSVN